MIKLNNSLLVILLLFATLCANAQNGVNSPYSRYGFGLLSDRAMGFNKGMGGVAQGFRDGQSVNIQNPASYSGIDSLTALFDFGFSLQNSNFKMGNVQKNVRNSSIDYFALHFRAAKNVGVAVGILPISNIKYNLTSNAEAVSGSPNITSTYTYSGDGGLHEVFLGAGWRPFKPISVGLNVAYLYGDYNQNQTMSFSETTANSVLRSYTADISTFNIDFGAQYIQPLGKEDQIVVGANYTLGHNVNNNATCTTSTTNSATLIESKEQVVENAFQLPHAIAAGITYYRSNKMRVGVDVELQKWNKCKFPTSQEGKDKIFTYQATKGVLNDRKKVAAGIDWTPNAYAKSYLSHITYKLGGYYSQSYANADLTGTVTDKPTEFGLSAGFTFPIMNRNLWHNGQKINVSFQWIHSNIPYLNSYTQKQAKLTENYLKLCIGITFSERWFYKWKVQ